MFFGLYRSDKRETKRETADLTKLLRQCARNALEEASLHRHTPLALRTRGIS